MEFSSSIKATRFPHRVAFLLVLIVYLATMVWHNRYDSHEHLWQAWAWLHGSLNVDGIPIHERASWRGHTFILHPPLSTIILLPFVMLFGPDFHEVIVTVLMGALDAALVWKLTERWSLVVFSSFGTVLWYEATLGSAWGFCLILAATLTLAVLVEMRGRRRAWLIGTLAGLAALARYDLVVVWPIYVLWFWHLDRPRRESRQNHKDSHRSNRGEAYALANTKPSFGVTPGSVFGMLPGFVFAAFSYVLFNYARYGTITDIGLNLWYQIDPAGAAANPGLGPFSLHYLPANLFTAIFIAPNFSRFFPWVRPTPMGQSLLLTSPAFLLAFRARWDDLETILLWCAMGLCMVGCLTVWANGYMQFGARYWILAQPFLLLLMAKGWKTDQMAVVLVGLSVLLVATGLLTIRLYGWG